VRLRPGGTGTMRRDRAGGRHEGGFSMIEVQMAILILTVISLASWGTINSTLALMGSKPQWSSQKTARLWTIASSRTQSELENAKQLGFGVACANPPCTTWVRTLTPGTVEVSTDNCATWSSSNPPFSEGPVLSGDFPWGRIVITTDPNTPTDPTTGASYLQVIEVDIFQTQPACGSPTPYLTAYTSVGIR
jgi:Tfp pilus assembly protein PilV